MKKPGNLKSEIKRQKAAGVIQRRGGPRTKIEAEIVQRAIERAEARGGRKKR